MRANACPPRRENYLATSVPVHLFHNKLSKTTRIPVLNTTEWPTAGGVTRLVQIAAALNLAVPQSITPAPGRAVHCLDQGVSLSVSFLTRYDG